MDNATAAWYLSTIGVITKRGGCNEVCSKVTTWQQQQHTSSIAGDDAGINGLSINNTTSSMRSTRLPTAAIITTSATGTGQTVKAACEHCNNAPDFFFENINLLQVATAFIP